MNRILEWLLNITPGKLAGGEWRIGLVSDYNNYVKLALIGVAVAMVWLTVHCYRREGDTPRRKKGILAGLRIAVIMLVLLTLLQPAVIVRMSETLYSTVLVLIDDSMSMSYKDTYADPAQAETRKGLAKTLSVNGNRLTGMTRQEILKDMLDRRDGPLAKLAKDHPIEVMRFSTNRREKGYTRPLGPTIPLAPPRLPETKPKAPKEKKPAAAADKLFARAREMVEKLQARKALDADDVREILSDFPLWIRHLPTHAEKFIKALESAVGQETDGGARKAANRLLGEIRNPPFIPGDVRTMLAWLRAQGYNTNHATAIREALDSFQGRKIGAIVLLGDGQPTEAGSSKRLAAALEYAGAIPRYTVLIGDPTPPKNLAVTALRAPREIRAGGKTTLTVMLSHRNLAGEQAEVRLYRRKAGENWPANLAAQKPIVRKVVKLKAPKSVAGGARSSQSVQLTFESDSKGLGEYVYRAVVAKRSDELTGEDNFADVLVKISDKKIRILLISGDAGWEFRFIRDYYLRQPELYRLSVWQQNADTEVNQAASTGMKLTRLPKTLKELIQADTSRPAPDLPKDKDRATTRPAGKSEEIPPGYDVVILYDPSPSRDGFDANFMKNLHDFVTIHRGGLCYIASRRNTFEVLRDPAAKPLADLLPVTVTQNQLDVATIIHETRPRAHAVRLTSYGYDHPITKLESTSEVNRKIWSLLPGVYWSHAVAWQKPTARILAENANPLCKTTGKGRPEPLIAVHSAGSGRVLYLGFDETWRWRFLEDGYYHRRFWSNVASYLAPLSARQVVITTGGDRFSAGEKITLEVEAFDREYKPLTDETFEVLQIDTKTGKTRKHELHAVKGKPGRYKAQIIADRTGTFELTCPETVAERSRVASKQILVELPQAEARRTEANERVMRSIATKPQYFLRADQINQLAELIPADHRKRYEDEQHTLWDTKAMLLLIVILLAVEWMVRKRSNLA